MSDTADSTIGVYTLADSATVAVLLRQACARGLERLDAELLLVRATGGSRAALRAHAEQQVGKSAQVNFAAECARRLAGEPLAYIEGTKEFWSLPLQVTPAVLVPRPETELLVELCLALLPAAPQQVADLGTGSGAIALALAHERPNWSIIATDTSAEALAVARTNAALLGLEHIDFKLGHWCAPLGAQRLDAILSNPPYIDPDDPVLTALAHEPLSALAAADEGYADLYQIAFCARRHLRAGGLLLLEHGSTQGPQIAQSLRALGYRGIVCHPDLAGLARVTQAYWTQDSNTGDAP